MGMGGDMYDQYCMREYMESGACLETRKGAINTAYSILLHESRSSCPTTDLSGMVSDNHRYARRLIRYCRWTIWLPWCIARRFAP
jgi:hypothetical protein